jgi:hypothetical protein
MENSGETVVFIKGGKVIGEFGLNIMPSSFAERESIGMKNGLKDWDFHTIRTNGKWLKTENGLIIAQRFRGWNDMVHLNDGLNLVNEFKLK